MGLGGATCFGVQTGDNLGGGGWLQGLRVRKAANPKAGGQKFALIASRQQTRSNRRKGT